MKKFYCNADSNYPPRDHRGSQALRGQNWNGCPHAFDGKLGPDGKLWVGVMDYAATEGRGSLWRVGRDGSAQQLLEGLTIPNGLDWWQDEFWFVNGPAEHIHCYQWDESGLTPTPHRFDTTAHPTVWHSMRTARCGWPYGARDEWITSTAQVLLLIPYPLRRHSQRACALQGLSSTPSS